jgi:hypothetical protein
MQSELLKAPMKILRKKSRIRVDDVGSRAIFVIPPEAGLQKSRDQMKLVLADSGTAN